MFKDVVITIQILEVLNELNVIDWLVNLANVPWVIVDQRCPNILVFVHFWRWAMPVTIWFLTFFNLNLSRLNQVVLKVLLIMDYFLKLVNLLLEVVNILKSKFLLVNLSFLLLNCVQYFSLFLHCVMNLADLVWLSCLLIFLRLIYNWSFIIWSA